MTARVLDFPLRRSDAVVSTREDDAWLVIVPRGHGWLHATEMDAIEDAAWLSANYGLPSWIHSPIFNPRRRTANGR